MTNLFALFLSLFVSGGAVFAGGTVVGNGGDPIFEFSEAARASMVETLKIIAKEPAEKETFCALPALSAEETGFCREFFIAVIPDLLRLSQGVQKVPFVLRGEPLLVSGPDGNPMRVAARTESGPNGPIELHRDSVKTLIPTQMLFLITHEFLHKVAFRGQFVGDNERIGPFASGRDLLDSVAKSVVTVARRKGQVGSQFGIQDIFDCTVSTGASRFGARLSSARLFRSEDLMSYVTSLGGSPTDGSLYLPETNLSSVRLRFAISEPNNCGDAHEGRRTSVQILRQQWDVTGEMHESVLAQNEFPGNPMCANSSAEFEIAWNQVRFACRYFGSFGTTSSVFSVKSLGTVRKGQRPIVGHSL